LNQEASYIRHLKRLVEFEEIHSPHGMSIPGDRHAHRRIFLFFEKHTGDPGLVQRWPALQEVVLKSSLRELRQIHHCYCKFQLPEGSNGSGVILAFHLLKSATPEGHPDGWISSGLESADLVFEQDRSWRELGYSLYLPQGYYLNPPLRPAFPGERTGPAPSPGLDQHTFPGTADERRLFNDLVSQAVYQPDGAANHAGLESGQRATLYCNPDSENNSLCLIYTDPVLKLHVPIYLESHHWSPLTDVAPVQLNQAGLTGPVTGLLERVESQFLNATRPLLDRKVMEEIQEELADELIQVLDKGLLSRESELEDELRRRENQLRQQTKDQAREFERLLDEWRRTRQALGKAITALLGSRTGRLVHKGGKIRDVKKIIEQLEQRASKVDKLAQSGAQNWDDFVNQIIAVTEEIEIEVTDREVQVAQRIQQTDQRIQAHDTRFLRAVRPQIAQLEKNLDEFWDGFNGRIAALTRANSLLAQLRALIEGRQKISGEENVPESEGRAQNYLPPTPDLQVNLDIAHGEIAKLQEELTNNESELIQQSNEFEDRLLELRREWNISLQEQQKQFAADQSHRERELERELDALARDFKSLQAKNNDLRQKYDEARIIAQSAQAEVEQAIQVADKQVRELENKLHDLQKQVSLFEVESFSLRNQRVRSWFERLSQPVDDLYIAEQYSPENAEGLAQIRRKFQTLFENEFSGLSVIQVIPGETIFNPSLHKAVGSDNIEELPDDVITRVIAGGYQWDNKVREAQVFVNLHSLKEDNGS